MARIFYHTDTGNIHGVHDGTFSGTLPGGIDFIDVAESPDQIVWPVNAAGDSGERFARVVGGVLIARERPDFDAEDEAQVDAAFNLAGIDRAELRLIFEIVKAIKTGNQTFFDSVTDVPTFKALARSLIR